MSRTILAHYTPARFAWLVAVERDPLASRGRGRVGYDCMQLLWTEWVPGQPGAEILTDAGIAQLAQWRAQFKGQNAQ